MKKGGEMENINTRLFGMSEKSHTFKYVLLTTKVVQVLQNVEKGNQLQKRDEEILLRGVELIKKIIEGAILAEGKSCDSLAPSREGLSAYGYALSTIETLNLINSVEGFTDYFKELMNQVVEITNKKSVYHEHINNLKKFFIELGNAFRGDLRMEKYTQPVENPFSRKISLNALSFQ